MPAKKTRGGHPSELRWGEKSEEEIRRYVQQLRDQAAELEALADAMRESGLEKVRLDGVTKVERAARQIDLFLGYLEAAVGETRREKRRQQRET